MTKAAAISTKIDPKLKISAERSFRKLGLTTTKAITLFYKQVDLQERLPFNAQIPKPTTKKALKDAKERRKL